VTQAAPKLFSEPAVFSRREDLFLSTQASDGSVTLAAPHWRSPTARRYDWLIPQRKAINVRHIPTLFLS